MAELSPERHAVLQAQAQARGLTVQQLLLQLGEHSGKSSLGGDNGNTPDDLSISCAIAAIMSDVPPEELAKLPEDGASEHDQYLRLA